MIATEQVIEELTASLNPHSDIRQQYFLRESLRNLVRLAKAEQMQVLRHDTAKVLQPAGEKSSIFAAPQ